MEALKKLSIGKISKLHETSKFPVEVQLRKNGQIFKPLSKSKYRCHFCIGPVTQNLKKHATASWKVGMEIVCDLNDEKDNNVVWWSKLTPEFSTFIKLVKTSHPSKKRIENLLRFENDDLYLLYNILQGKYEKIPQQMEPITCRPLHPFRRINHYKKFRGYRLSHDPIYFAFLASVFTSQLKEYEHMFVNMPTSVQNKYKQFHPEILEKFHSFISSAC